MKKWICYFFILTVLLMNGCATSNTQEHNYLGTEPKHLYTIDDFSGLVLGESGIDDLLQVGEWSEMLVMSSYGALCIYPAAPTGSIKIKLLAETGKLIVWSVEYAGE